ncbi:hypothetical protein C815_00040 [Firmicutes bacterium M10-2]|nr:hypothetical protein C815_00040 [Firmicutes bacterium M10-2]
MILKNTQKVKLGIHFLIIIIISVLQIVYPMIISRAIGKIDSTIMTVLLLAGLLMIMKFVFSLLDSWLTNTLYWHVLNEGRMRLVEKLVGSSYVDFQKLDAAKSIMAVENDLETITNFMLIYLTSLIKDVLFIAGVILVGFMVNLSIGLSLLGIMFVMFIVFWKINQQARPLYVTVKKAGDQFLTILFDTNTLMSEMKYLHQENFLKHRLRKAIQYLFESQIPTNYVSYRLWITSLVSFGTIRIVILIVGLVYSVPLSAIYLFIYYLDLLNDPIEEFRINIEELPSLEASRKRIREIENVPIRRFTGETSVGSLQTIKISDLDFSYGENTVFSKYSLTLEHGKTYGLNGKSGVGKSTLINLISQLLIPDHGTILYNNIPYENVNHQSLLREIVYIDQEESMRENLDRFIEQLEAEQDMFSRMYGIDIHNLSHGQKAFMQVLYALQSSSSLLIFDETFAQIDGKLITCAFDQFHAADKIIFIISHDENILKQCDETIELRRKEL